MCRCVNAVTDRFRDGKGLVKLLKENGKTMSKYRISYNMDTCDIMNSLFESERVGFVYECYDCLSVEQQKIYRDA